MDERVKRRRDRAVFTLAAVFAVIFTLLLLNSGQCERYEKKMQRQQLMKNYIDSVRHEEQLKKLER